MQPPPPLVLTPKARAEDSPLAEAGRQIEAAKVADASGRHEDAVALLRGAAEMGHPQALSFLGARLLVGRGAPLRPAEALPMLARAAEGNDPDAHLILATVAAASAGAPMHWERVLDHLERAAELGSGRAQGQLVLLSGFVGRPPATPGVWSRLRRGVNVGAWTRSPPKRVLSETPRIRVVERFLSPAACDWLVERARPLLKPATVYDMETGLSRQEEARSNSAVEFDPVNADVVLMLVRARIGAATALPPVAMEPPQVLHYTAGQRFEAHYDFLDPSVEGYARDIAVRGQRVATFLTYLNDDYEGGETDFPKLGLRHRGRKGDALFFANVDVQNRPDPLTLHAGLPPSAGVKWLLSQWVRDRVGPQVA